MDRRRAIAIGLLLIAPAAGAQDVGKAGGESGLSRQIVVRNQLGLLRYCRDQGFAAEPALSDARRAVDRLRSQAGPGAPPAVGDAAEAAGARGMIAFGTSSVRLEASASAAGTTLRWQCEELAQIAAAQAAR